MVAMSTPALRRWMAVVCRNEWGWMLFSARVDSSPASISTYLRSKYRTPKRVSGVPRSLRKDPLLGGII